MLLPELQRRQNNSVAKRKQIVFFAIPSMEVDKLS